MKEYRKSDNVFLQMALKNYYEAAEALGLPEGVTRFLAHSERQLRIAIPVTMDDG